jgi:hypothetical protein
MTNLPNGSILTPRVRELSKEIVHELKAAMLEKRPSRASAEAEVTRLTCDIWEEALLMMSLLK